MHDIYSRGAVPCKGNSVCHIPHVKISETTPDELRPLELVGAEKNMSNEMRDSEDEDKTTSDSSLQAITIDVSPNAHNSETEDDKSPPV
jgi:hypothetical protein